MSVMSEQNICNMKNAAFNSLMLMCSSVSSCDHLFGGLVFHPIPCCLHQIQCSALVLAPEHYASHCLRAIPTIEFSHEYCQL